MARLPVTASKAERVELHKAKMAGKKFDRERAYQRDQAQRAANAEAMKKLRAAMAATNARIAEQEKVEQK